MTEWNSSFGWILDRIKTLAIAYSTVAVVNDSHDPQVKWVPADLKLQREYTV